MDPYNITSNCIKRQGGLFGMPSTKLKRILGEGVNKVWSFTEEIDGEKIECIVWDHHGSSRYGEYYTYGPHSVMKKMFGDYYMPPLGG